MLGLQKEDSLTVPKRVARSAGISMVAPAYDDKETIPEFFWKCRPDSMRARRMIYGQPPTAGTVSAVPRPREVFATCRGRCTR